MSLSATMSSFRAIAGPENLRHFLNSHTLNWIRYGSIVLPLLLLAFVFLQPWGNPVWMFFDPLTAAEESGDCCHTYYGFMSYLGIMIWTGTAAVCLFCALMLGLERGRSDLFWFSLAAGALAGWLALDDAFFFNELVLPNLGIPQVLVLSIYAALALAYIALGWRVVLGADYVLLLIGGSALVVSLLIDTLTHGTIPIRIYFEDGAKFLGIFCWGAFHMSTMLDKMLALREAH